MSRRMQVSEPFRRIEVFTGEGRRRSWSPDDKAAIVAESYAGADGGRPLPLCLVDAQVADAVEAGQNRLGRRPSGTSPLARNAAGYSLENAVAQLLAVYQAQGRLQYQKNYNGGRYDPKRGVYLLPTGAGRVEGVPDFTCSVAPTGQTLHLECKAGTGRQTDAQRAFQRVPCWSVPDTSS